MAAPRARQQARAVAHIAVQRAPRHSACRCRARRGCSRECARAGIEVEPIVEADALHRATELGEGVAAAERPVQPAGAMLVFEHLHLIAGLAQLDRRRQPREACPEYQHAGAGRRALQVWRAAIRRFMRVAQAGHGQVHHRPAGDRADHRGQVAPARSSASSRAMRRSIRHETKIVALGKRAACRPRYLRGRAALTSISTSQSGLARAATWKSERVGRFGCNGVPKNSR